MATVSTVLQQPSRYFFAWLRWKPALLLTVLVPIMYFTSTLWPGYKIASITYGQFYSVTSDCGIDTGHVIVTFVHDDKNYIDCANRLALSLDLYGHDINRVAMVIDTVDGLKGWKQCTFKEVNNNVRELVEAWDKILTKLEVLRLQGRIDKLVYIDADCLAGPRFLELFDVDVETDTIAAPASYDSAPDGGSEYKPFMNAGVMVLKPSPKLFHGVIDLEHVNATSTDQDLLWNAINFGRIKWKPLERGLILSRAEVSLFEGQPYGVCHWAGFDKPWTGCEGKNDSMCKPWNRFGTMV